jgi:hypothetical protein
MKRALLPCDLKTMQNTETAYAVHVVSASTTAHLDRISSPSTELPTPLLLSGLFIFILLFNLTWLTDWYRKDEVAQSEGNKR